MHQRTRSDDPRTTGRPLSRPDPVDRHGQCSPPPAESGARDEHAESLARDWHWREREMDDDPGQKADETGAAEDKKPVMDDVIQAQDQRAPLDGLRAP